MEGWFWLAGWLAGCTSPLVSTVFARPVCKRVDLVDQVLVQGVGWKEG
ncbi:uncharacterized protein RAG0_00422 [Rhynchosporium agropyri]|uniref:Uncharacterized protein n=1 Tax=Rhynchosporium agropyri TaxID=914238 RepID=A0A1E1JSH9_9HELO|nr:uncharacterized protein RAG0_00422 [Rhynchosporium agropyri]